MHHAQENQYAQRLPGLRIHTRCILSENTRNAMACRCIRCPEPCRNILYLHRKACMPHHSTATHHTLQPFHPRHCSISHLLLYPTTVSLHSQTPHMHLPHGALMFPFPSALSCVTPSNEQFRVSRCAIRDDAVSIQCCAGVLRRRCRVNSVLSRGLMRKGCDKASVVELASGTTYRVMARVASNGYGGTGHKQAHHINVN
jgi:hypothetical protein